MIHSVRDCRRYKHFQWTVLLRVNRGFEFTSLMRNIYIRQGGQCENMYRSSSNVHKMEVLTRSTSFIVQTMFLDVSTMK